MPQLMLWTLMHAPAGVGCSYPSEPRLELLLHSFPLGHQHVCDIDLGASAFYLGPKILYVHILLCSWYMFFLV